MCRKTNQLCVYLPKTQGGLSVLKKKDKKRRGMCYFKFQLDKTINGQPYGQLGIVGQKWKFWPPLRPFPITGKILWDLRRTEKAVERIEVEGQTDGHIRELFVSRNRAWTGFDSKTRLRQLDRQTVRKRASGEPTDSEIWVRQIDWQTESQSTSRGG